jgi:hypothetical protein
MTEAEAAGSADFAERMMHILNEAALALVEDQIVDCFRHDGGVPYSAFPQS